jgi:D-alanyl-D-alanine carboxypeptidase (penicillin-binding protein 5/6)
MLHRSIATFVIAGIISLSSMPVLAAANVPEAPPKVDESLRAAGAAAAIVTADGTALTSTASHIHLMDFDTGTVLAHKAGDAKMYPSSMTKMMTLYLVFDRLKQGTLTLDSQFTVSEKAWRMQGSKTFVQLGAQIRLEDLIRGIAVQSGNDACVTVAEGIAGSEEAFANQMNDVAKKLGMTGSNFVDSSGWPHADHYTTAQDLAVLGVALIRDFPEYYHYVSEREFTYHNIRQFNRNLLLNNAAMQVDGIKTGHTEAAGYGITLSAREPASGRRLVLVINGLSSEAERAAEGERLLSWGFHNFDNVTLVKANEPIANANVWLGTERTVPLMVAADVNATMGKVGAKNVTLVAEYQGPVATPIKQGQEIGKLKITHTDGRIQELPLLAAADVERLSRFARIPRVIGSWFGGK